MAKQDVRIIKQATVTRHDGFIVIHTVRGSHIKILNKEIPELLKAIDESQPGRE